jgi:hypothetical protein
LIVDISTQASAGKPKQVSTGEREDITYHDGNVMPDAETSLSPHIKHLYDSAARDLWTSIPGHTLGEKVKINKAPVCMDYLSYVVVTITVC